MSKYDFAFLSSFDFEELVRDLLQAELSVTLECFKSGRDGGIDLRYTENEGRNFIVQCKHYSGSSVKTLLQRLRVEEREKVQRLKPSRYVFATSLGLTPRNKQEILKLFSPYCLSTGDILGRDDLNNLLRKFPEIEKRNFKLWLTSHAVLERVLHSAIFTQTDFDLERVKRKLKYYVQNESYFQAKATLEKHHCCIVAGIPGIGKTTLAEILLIDYLARGFQPIRVIGDIKEAMEVYHSAPKRIYYYDDFLGQTSLENKLAKNEEQGLLSFIEAAERTDSVRIVLTTREYILNQARASYEKLARSNFEIFKCVINLSNYTRYDRAKILFNHVYFSGLSGDYRNALLRDRSYMKIVDHPNFNPRIIEWMTDFIKETGVRSEEYVFSFLDNLKNPSRLWEHAFHNQISNASRHLCLVLATLPAEVFRSDLESAFWLFYKRRAEQFGFQTMPNDFLKALKELEGSFIHTQRVGESDVVRFHNPSIKDFLEGYLSSSPTEVGAICSSAMFFDQCIALWRYCEHEKATKVRSILRTQPEIFWGCIERTFISADSRLINVVSRHGGLIGKNKNEKPIETRAVQTIEIEKGFSFDGATDVISKILRVVWTRLKSGSGHKGGLLLLLSCLKKKACWYGLSTDEFLETAKIFLMKSPEWIDDFKYYIEFRKDFPGVASKDDDDEMMRQFLEFYPAQVESWLYDEDDSHYLNDEVSTFRNVFLAFDLGLEGEFERLEERISELEARASGEESASDEYYPSTPSRERPSEDEDIHSLFDSLAEPSSDF